MNFDILDRHTPLPPRILLEASAGTGKTFSIEHLVIRLLLDPERSLSLSKMVIMTFTHAACEDLFRRIAAGLDKAIDEISDPSGKVDYILFLLETHDPLFLIERLLHAKRELSHAPILTIHGLCQRMLSRYGKLAHLPSHYDIEENLTKSLIQNRLRKEAYEKNISPDDLVKMRSSLWMDRIDRAINQEDPSLLEGEQSSHAAAIHLVSMVIEEKRALALEGRLSSPNDLLWLMNLACEKEDFVSALCEEISVWIIDEFQDTDPLQWSIFQKIALNQNPAFIALIGDPKQSIYGFRKADLTIFQEAKEKIPFHAKLSCNFRSTPDLIDRLGKIFENMKGGFALTGSLPFDYYPIISRKEQKSFKDGHGSMILYTEGDYPLIMAQQIRSLYFEENIPLSQMAILVRTHDEGIALREKLLSWGIPSITPSEKWAQKPFFKKLWIIAQSLCDLKSSGWRRACISDAFFYEMKIAFEEKGLAALWNLLSPESAEYPFLFSYLVTLFGSHPKSASLAIALDELSTKDYKEGTALLEKISILTLHASKGLEFEIVFIPGLMHRSKKPTHPLAEDREALRLLYVALTRAKSRLFLFHTFHDKPPQLGTASPLELLFAMSSLSEAASSHEQLYEKIGAYPDHLPFTLNPPLPHWIEGSFQETLFSEKLQIPSPIKGCQPLSYTALKEHKQLFKPSLKPGPGDLPAGTEVGILLHKALEMLFKSGYNRSFPCKDSLLSLNKILFGTLLDGHQTKIVEIFHALLHFAIPSEKKAFTLATSCPKDLIAEHHFLDYSSTLPFTGSIDLVCRREGKLHLFDWKSNFLGPLPEDYQLDALKKVMEEEGYIDQKIIYNRALSKEPIEATHYLFLRGLIHGQGLISSR